MHLWGLVLTLIMFGAGGALAQQALELPMPQTQSTQPLRPRTNPTEPSADPALKIMCRLLLRPHGLLPGSARRAARSGTTSGTGSAARAGTACGLSRMLA